MPIAAVPAYLCNEFKDASPGSRFGMYLKLWGINRRTNALLWTTHDVGYEVRGQDRREREVRYENKTDALKQSARLNDADKAVYTSLALRQSCVAATLSPTTLLRLEAQAISPFATGLGNEHPLENGFAFLNPYGLPYLPGSGVKGVLRQAARELASGEWRETHGWSESQPYRINVGSPKDPRWLELSMPDVLFGRETPPGDPDHVRGALSFWDVIPQIEGNSLLVEIMTPHQSHYYQQNPQAGSTTPHDSGQPNPICFLTVPPGSRLTFHVVCDEQHLRRLTSEKNSNAPDLLAAGETHWKTLLQAAFQHAFQWLGFGAKTAVGYGVMQAVESAASTPTSPQEGTAAATASQPKPAALSVQATQEQWTNVTLTYQKGGGGVITVTGPAGKAEARGPQAQAVMKTLSPEQTKRLEKKGSLTNLTVLVVIEGNLRTVKAVVQEASTH